MIASFIVKPDCQRWSRQYPERKQHKKLYFYKTNDANDLAIYSYKNAKGSMYADLAI